MTASAPQLDQSAIRAEALHRGVSRLCHFTPTRNLVHIATGEAGIVATRRLRNDDQFVHTATDPDRWDGQEEYISCSIQYPNIWYLDQARERDPVFTDWVILLIAPRFLWAEGTRYCPVNAAASRGSRIADGLAGFKALFASAVTGARGFTRTRQPNHLACCPTDDQAEVLVRDRIPMEDIRGLAVVSETQAKAVAAQLFQLNVPTSTFIFVIAPTLFDKRKLSDSIRQGKRPEERVWVPEGHGSG